MDIVIDKSFFQWVSPARVIQLCEEHNVLMIDMLFRELMQTDEASQAKCFGKFPCKDNPVTLIDSVGELMQYEIQHHSSCQPVRERCHRGRFCFNPGLAKGDFQLSPAQLQSIAEGRSEMAENVEMYKKMWAGVDYWFPDIKEYCPGRDSSPMNSNMTKVATDSGLVGNIYDQIRQSDWPAGDIIDPEWVLFRRTQAHLLWALEYIRQYGADPNVSSSKLENELADISYGITGALSGCLATLDKKMTKLSKLMRPGITIISLESFDKP